MVISTASSERHTSYKRPDKRLAVENRSGVVLRVSTFEAHVFGYCLS